MRHDDRGVSFRNVCSCSYYTLATPTPSVGNAQVLGHPTLQARPVSMKTVHPRVLVTSSSTDVIVVVVGISSDEHGGLVRNTGQSTAGQFLSTVKVSSLSGQSDWVFAAISVIGHHSGHPTQVFPVSTYSVQSKVHVLGCGGMGVVGSLQRV